MRKPRLVIDTCICLDLFHFEVPLCATLLAALDEGAVEAVTSDACRDEWLRVLRYPKLRLDDAKRDALQARFDASIALIPAAELASRATIALPRCADADDQKFLELARDAEATALITKDRSLLELWRRVARAGLFAIVPPESLVRQALGDERFWRSMLGDERPANAR